MKLGKEEIKKIGASVLLLTGLLWAYFALLLGPLETNEEKSATGIQVLEPQIADAKQQIVKTAALEKKAPVATAALNQLKSGIPDGAPIAWFPPRMADFFKRHGIEKTSVHLVSEEPDSGVPGFRKLIWAVEIQKVEFVSFGQAVASLENEEPLLNVINVTVEATREDAQFQHAVLTVSTLVKS